MGALEPGRLLDCRLLQHQHVDDLVFHDRRRSLMVAVLAVRLDRLLHRGRLRVRHRPYRGHLPHRIPRSQQILLRRLGESLAGLQPRCHGMYMVRRAGLHRGSLRLPDDPFYMESMGP
ncbi:hypothetical protein VTK73DRAFT_4540 [Phialemonium thermophilum]|uniref:Uncharacterized protein n=1 Tax=Phialemonium thermophilum TaxID=223376 RepID=A0ABR3WSU2_9PEZI